MRRFSRHHKLCRAIVILVLCTLAAQSLNNASAFDSDKIESLLQKWSVPGGAVAVVKDGKVVFARGYGFCDAEHPHPVDPNRTIFRIASISKVVTAAAILALVRDGKLGLEDKVFALLKEYEPSDPRAQQITIRQLLDMTAGWDKQRSGDPILQPFIRRAARKMNVEAPADFDVTVRYVLRRKLDFAPGSRFAYSNFEYGLLGKVIEKVSEKPYANFVRDVVIEPAGVTLSEAHTREADRLPEEVSYYAPKERSRRSLFAGDRSCVPAPYARAFLEQDLPMIGWAGSASQVALLVDYILGNASTRETICAGGAKQFSMGWELKHPSTGACEFFKDGTLPGTRAFAMRTADGTTWVALFNGRPTQKVPDPFAREVRQIMSTVSSCPESTIKTSTRQTLP